MPASRGLWQAGSWVLLLAGLPRPDECSACQDREPCAPHEQSAAEGLRAWTPALKDPDPARRREALEQLAALNGEHANAPLRELTEAVAAGLKDEELTVRARAAVLLSTGQDPKTARSALIRGLDPLSDVLQRRQASPGSPTSP